MSKIPIDLERYALSGPTMGTRWSAVFYAAPNTDLGPIAKALADAVETVDRQMSTWSDQSDLMRLNAAPLGKWITLPPELMQVLVKGLEIGKASQGAYDIGLGDIVAAWGFGPNPADVDAIRAALNTPRPASYDILELDPENLLCHKHAPIAIDLNGIAKGFGVDEMLRVLLGFGISDALLGLDGELRAIGTRPNGAPWNVAIERPDYETRAPLSMLELHDCAVATSGDYRHWVTVGQKRFSHTIDPKRGGPLTDAAASATVLAKTCIEADAWATAFMVCDTERAMQLAQDNALRAVLVHRDGTELRQTPIGWDRPDPETPGP